MPGVELIALLPVFVGVIWWVRAVGELVRLRRLGRRGIHTTGTVIKHEDGNILVEFVDQQQRSILIAEPRKRLDPVGDHVPVSYPPEEPDNGRVSVTASELVGMVLGLVLWGFGFVVLGVVLLVVV